MKIRRYIAVLSLLAFACLTPSAADDDFDAGSILGGGDGGGGAAAPGGEKPKSRYEQKKAEREAKRQAREKARRQKTMEAQKAARDKANEGLPEEKRIQYIDNVPDGIYQGSAQSYKDVIEVAVKILNGRLESIRVMYHDETSTGLSAVSDMIPRMVKANSGSVDAVSGATVTSTAFSSAVNAAIASGASGEPLDSWPTPPSRAQRKAEKRRAEEEAQEKADRLARNKARREERESKRQAALERRTAARGKKLNLLREGEERRLTADETTEENFEKTYFDDHDDGWYVGSGIGYKSKQIVLAMRIKDGEIINIKVLKEDEEKPRGAFQKIFKQVISTNSVEAIDTVSGATMTSTGVVAALQAALKGECLKKMPKKGGDYAAPPAPPAGGTGGPAGGGEAVGPPPF